MLTQIHHKKNELQEVKFFEDAECTVPFDFTEKKNLYILSKDGDITPLLEVIFKSINIAAYTPYIPNVKIIKDNPRIKTIKDITLNLSKYIPEDNAVLFLNEEDMEKYYNSFRSVPCCVNIEDCYSCYFCGEAEPSESHVERCYIKDLPSFRREKGCDDFCFEDCIAYPKLITIFLPHGTQSELQKANEVAKELKEKHGVEEVNLFAKDWFLPRCEKYYEEEPIPEWFEAFIKIHDEFVVENNIDNKDAFNKIITTNSTGILSVQDTERLQVIDCKEIFEEYLKENNL